MHLPPSLDFEGLSIEISEALRMYHAGVVVGSSGNAVEAPSYDYCPITWDADCTRSLSMDLICPSRSAMVLISCWYRT